MHHRVAALGVHHRPPAQPVDQLAPRRARRARRSKVSSLRARSMPSYCASRCRSWLPSTVTARVAEIAHEAQHLERLRPAVDQVADEPERGRCRVEADFARAAAAARRSSPARRRSRRSPSATTIAARLRSSRRAGGTGSPRRCARRRCVGLPREVGDGARHAQHAMVGARRKQQPRERVAQQLIALAVGGAVPVDLARAEQRVRPCPAARAADACALLDARLGSHSEDSAATGATSSLSRGAGTSSLRSMRSASGPGDAAAVARDALGRAAAAAAAVAAVPAGAGIHRGDQLEARRELRLARGARDRDAARIPAARAAPRARRGRTPAARRGTARRGARARSRPAAAARRRRPAPRRSAVVRRAVRPLAPAQRFEAAASRPNGSPPLRAPRLRTARAGCRESAPRASTCRCPAGRPSARCAPPAAATSSARFACCWPFTSLKSA